MNEKPRSSGLFQQKFEKSKKQQGGVKCKILSLCNLRKGYAAVVTAAETH